MGIVIDSSVLIAAERGQIDLERPLSIQKDEEAVLAAITASEVLHGVHRATPKQRPSAPRDICGTNVRSLPRDPVRSTRGAYSRASGSGSGGVWGHCGRTRSADRATAIANGYSVPTRDKRSFPKIPGLVTIIRSEERRVGKECRL